MSWPKGLPKPKTGGRKTGTPNKRTVILREVLESLDFDLPKRLIELLPDLDKPKQADVLLELMSYVYPKRKAVEHSGPDGQAIQIHQSRIQMKALIANPETFTALVQIEKTINEIKPADAS
jgi:hypothetical protein